MHWKKDLKIETKFFEDDIQGIPDAILVPPTQEFIRIDTGPSDDQEFLTRTGAEVIERILSNRIIENFLSCWETLKEVTLPPTVYRSHHRTSHSSLLSHNKNQENRNHLTHHYDRILINDEMHSSNIDWLEHQKQGFYFKTKIAETHVEKAKILKDIVQKLKRARKEAVNIDQNIVRIRSNHLLLSQIKQLEQVTNQLQMERVNSSQKEKTISIKSNYVRRGHVDNEQKERERELEKTLWNELSLLKEELRGLRLDNETLLQRQLSKQQEINLIRKEKEELYQRYDILKEENYKNQTSNNEKKESGSNNFVYPVLPNNIHPLPQYVSPQPQITPSFQKRENQEPQRIELDLEFKQKYQKQRDILYQRIKNLEDRQELMRGQLLKELQLRQNYIKSNEEKQEKFRAQLLQAQKMKQNILQEQLQKQRVLKQSLEKEQLLKQRFLKQHSQKEKQLRQEMRKQQDLRQQALREQNQHELELRQKNIREFAQRENQLREQLLQEYKNRETSIRQQENRLKKLQNQQQRFLQKYEEELKRRTTNIRENEGLETKVMKKDSNKQKNIQKRNTDQKVNATTQYSPNIKDKSIQHQQQPLSLNSNPPIVRTRPLSEQIKFESQYFKQTRNKVGYLPQQEPHYHQEMNKRTIVQQEPRKEPRNPQQKIYSSQNQLKINGFGQQHQFESGYHPNIKLGANQQQSQMKIQYHPQFKGGVTQVQHYESQYNSNIKNEPKMNETTTFESTYHPQKDQSVERGNLVRTQKRNNTIDSSRYGETYGYSTTTTVKKVTSTQKPLVFWNSSQNQTTTKTTYYQGSQNEDKVKSIKQQGLTPDLRDWTKQDEEKSKYCGCCL